MKYPDSKIQEDDEGELRIILFIKDGRLVIDFGKECSWIGFNKQRLRNFIDLLENKYNNI